MYLARLATASTAVVLTAGLVACSDSGSSDSTSTVKETATETNVTTSASSAKSSASSAATQSSTSAAGETVEISTADGATALVPQGVSQAIDKFAQPEWGKPVSVEETPNGWIVAYDAAHYVTWNQNTGGAPTWGEIANNWITNVRTDSSLGFPLAPEEKLPDSSGWIQQFEHGTIEWTRGATNDAFEAVVTPK
ncbi:LGFP repeat protein [Corynebacterium capitovis DSM 44611]|uniref:LGFP repeat-containing protein n=1 Tax=Corynebacterium capitovis TaxID=131081 RepID=UPI00036927BD|nr:hypothetical protein [Corynebacterium capitovis]WKD57939.1 LGFP repeat protein [Corynebacterium capitovis DSM 44611]